MPLEIVNFGQPYAGLHKQAPSGWAVHAAYSANRFNNKLHDADVALYANRGNRWFGEIFHDTIEGRESDEGETSPGEGFVPVTYATNPGRVGIINMKLWLPPQGLYLPVIDEEKGYRFFKPGTLAPEKVTGFSQRTEAGKAFSEFDLSQDEISGFYRRDDYTGEKRFGGRGFNPSVVDDGRFSVDLDRLPSNSGNVWVGSRPAYAEKEVVAEI
ncbi:MAG: hypothetical protein HY513_04910 [Candidatus Aenigmarchaeota archaeon]|nr:hypothetical protein [Candidatus Aenigmarchaeota archaeon]